MKRLLLIAVLAVATSLFATAPALAESAQGKADICACYDPPPPPPPPAPPPPPPPPDPPPPPPPPPPAPWDDWDYNVGGYTDFNDSGVFLAGGCRHPVARREYRGGAGAHHWTYYTRVKFCWRNGRITSFSRERWIWMSGSILNGWSFKGHIGTNCNLENCSGRGVGSWSTTAWTQGKFEFCSIRIGLCSTQTPLIGIKVYGNGGVSYFRDSPQ